MKIPHDVIIQLEAPGLWGFYNVFTRDCLATGSDALFVIAELPAVSLEELATTYRGKTFKVWDIWRFSNYEGLFADPTSKRHSPETWPPPWQLDAESLVKLFSERNLLFEDEVRYLARFGRKRSILDTERFGNFHQQLGRELLLTRREEPNHWWLHQKFTDNLKDIRCNLYKAIQENYLRSYFRKKFSNGGDVVDIGCGTGFYTKLMAASGASNVLGLDPSAAFIDIARQDTHPRCCFKVCETIGQPDGLTSIPSASADFIFMSDALLFYFVAEAPTQKGDPASLLGDMRRILRPGGVISVEPHYQQWLAPWLGEPNHPFTALTEYANKTFGVTPNTSTLIQTFARSGFAVTWMDEMRPDPSYESVDARAYHFAQEFPLWQLYEVQPYQSGDPRVSIV